MSDTLLSLVPVDRTHVPAQPARERAVALLRTLAPSADEVLDTVSEEIVFIDCGVNWSGVHCPVCGRDADAWFAGAMSDAFERSRFRELTVAAPCCGAGVELDALDFGWPVGFARYTLTARNPGAQGHGFSGSQQRMVEEMMGCPLRVIWRRY